MMIEEAESGFFLYVQMCFRAKNFAVAHTHSNIHFVNDAGSEQNKKKILLLF